MTTYVYLFLSQFIIAQSLQPEMNEINKPDILNLLPGIITSSLIVDQNYLLIFTESKNIMSKILERISELIQRDTDVFKQ